MTEGTYVIDREGVVWMLVRDGAIATRADYSGAFSAGIQWLQQNLGPLLPFDPSSVGGVQQVYEAAIGPLLDDDPALASAWFSFTAMLSSHAEVG